MSQSCQESKLSCIMNFAILNAFSGLKFLDTALLKMTARREGKYIMEKRGGRQREKGVKTHRFLVVCHCAFPCYFSSLLAIMLNRTVPKTLKSAHFYNFCRVEILRKLCGKSTINQIGSELTLQTAQISLRSSNQSIRKEATTSNVASVNVNAYIYGMSSSHRPRTPIN